MLGEGQVGGVNVIPAPSIGVTGASYRLTWDATQTGYVCLNSLYIYNSTNGNQVNFKIEQFQTGVG